MELRHLRCFIAVADDLHFARAAERLHIEQSPLSRTIKELESYLAVQLFERTTRRTRLTWAGKVFLEEAHRIFAAIDQAKAIVKAAATGYHGRLRIALSDGIAQPRLSALLAQCREDEPEVEIRLSETPLSQQIKELHSDLYDAGFAQSDEVGEGITAEALYVGAIGSRRNSTQWCERLRTHFDLSEHALQALHGPAGLYIGSKTPAETALSIMAEVVAVKNCVQLPAQVQVAAGKSRLEPLWHPTLTAPACGV